MFSQLPEALATTVEILGVDETIAVPAANNTFGGYREIESLKKKTVALLKEHYSLENKLAAFCKIKIKIGFKQFLAISLNFK